MTTPPSPPERTDLNRSLARLAQGMHQSRRYDIGFPGASDLTFPALTEFFTEHLLNNVGDPRDPGRGRNHTKEIEQRVVAEVASLLRAPSGHWGYVTTGSTEGTLHALAEGARAHPDTVVYTSRAAHYSVAKCARLLRLPLVTVPTTAHGQLDIVSLRQEIAMRRHRAVAVVATAGTTMSEAVDDVAAIAEVCRELAVTRRRIHVDGALSGIPLALLPDGARPAADFAAGATSMVISGHKFLGTLMPCGVVVHRSAPEQAAHVPYTGCADTTITGSRSGHTPLLLWWVLSTLGRAGLHERAEASRRLARYTYEQLRTIGWSAWHQPHAFTVTLRTPPSAILEKWVLAADGDTAHIVCMPGVRQDQIDEFVTDLRAAIRWPQARVSGPSRAPLVPPPSEGHATRDDCSVSTTAQAGRIRHG